MISVNISNLNVWKVWKVDKGSQYIIWSNIISWRKARSATRDYCYLTWLFKRAARNGQVHVQICQKVTRTMNKICSKFTKETAGMTWALRVLTFAEVALRSFVRNLRDYTLFFNKNQQILFEAGCSYFFLFLWLKCF